jgi:hypothetical protein
VSTGNEILVIALKEAAKEFGFKGVRGVNYYLNQPETICVLNLQRSSFGPQFYLNAGIFLTRFGAVPRPKEYKCHIRWRLLSLIAPEEGEKFEAALNMENDIAAQARAELVAESAKRHGFEILAKCNTEQKALEIAGQIKAGIAAVALH